MQSDDQKICLGQEFVHLFVHSFIYWKNIKKRFLYPQSMRKYKPIVTRPLVHNDCAQGTTQGPEDHQLLVPRRQAQKLAGRASIRAGL